MMTISICFISRQSGALMQRKSMQEMNEFMHIIGKILEESHRNFLIHRSNVLNGNREHLSRYMAMVVRMSFYDHIAMDGKSKSIIRKTSK